MDIKPKYFHFAYEDSMKSFQNLIPCPDAIIKCYTEYEGKLKKPDLFGKTVRVTKHQIPDLYHKVKNFAEKADIDVPQVFLYDDFYYGVQAKGTENPRIEISAKTVADFSDEEFNFLLAREMCRIKHKMVKWTFVGEQYFDMLEKAQGIPGVETASKSLQMVYAYWRRLADYTADCSGYDTVADIRPCVKAIVTLVLNNISLANQVNIREYISQASDIYMMDDLVYRYSQNDEKIPYGPLRIKNLLSYAAKSVM